jgi:hypothetical protein
MSVKVVPLVPMKLLMVPVKLQRVTLIIILMVLVL